MYGWQLAQVAVMLFVTLCLLLFVNLVSAQRPPVPTGPLVHDKEKINYHPDSLGNRIPDYSYCGYMASEAAIPSVDVKVVVAVTKGDATLRIQSALDYVAGLTQDNNGFRGAVLLQKGTYLVNGQLKINAGGVVLRGSGSGTNGTVILGTGNDRTTLIRIAGNGDKTTAAPVKITNAYVPVNAATFSVTDASSFKTGDLVSVNRPSTSNWIKLLKTDHFGGGVTALGWKPGEHNLYFERRITAVEGNKITIDVPLTTALDNFFGGGYISKIHWPGRIEKTGIENLQLQSTFDNSNKKDESHRWMAVTLENVADAWVRQVSFKHFAGSAVQVLESAKRITVEDCISLEPISEIGGFRRYTFYTSGQQTLFQRCYAENGYHDFAVGFCAPGPNAFVQCQSVLPYSFSGTIDSWSSGVLFDLVNVDGQALRFGNRGQDAQGAGWTTANSLFWQCTASLIDCYKPPGANNYSFGSWSQFAGDGYWESSNEHIIPRSLYYAQLAERLQKDVSQQAQLLPVDEEASSSPPVAVAMALTTKAKYSPLLLVDWIKGASSRTPLAINSGVVKSINQGGIKPAAINKPAAPLQLRKGWLVRGEAVVTGSHREVPWWSGSILPNHLFKAKPHVTRFVPGRTGVGLTDDLDQVTDSMRANNIVALEHNYGLWYDRRRDDHERIRRMDGEVWAPFYELPFARSGQGLAWDGLSKYDLSKYNPWYWNRLKEFAELADQKSLVLIHQNYFQHNIIEAGAHYADFPWRTANNINNTGFPEPVPYAGDKRIFLADQFYDIRNTSRRKLHTAYIRKCLDNFKNITGVIQLIGAEYTGPLHFVQFWVDAIKTWENETGKNEIIGLSATRDVQDSILADPARAAVIDLIDIRYWHYQEDGKPYEPKGGQSLAPRQHARLLKPKRTSFEQVYRAVSEYKIKYPSKAIIYSGDSWDAFGWAVFMAGGSLAAIPKMDESFLKDAAGMMPLKTIAGDSVYALANGSKSFIIYCTNATAEIKLNKTFEYKVNWIDTHSGKTIKEETIPAGTTANTFVNPKQDSAILWIHSN